jgi:glycosyltransferase involved in cell wall biosynthesis
VSTRVWVIVPAYNEAARIGGTLACLAAQTDRELTLVVVDNGSSDSTAAVARSFAQSAPFPVHVISEPARGTGCAVDTGFRYAIEHGASYLARTDADCLPHPGWIAAARKTLGAGASMACGQIRARRDEHGLAGRAIFRLLVIAAAAFGRFRPDNRAGQRYLTPYRMHAGNNMAITATLYLATGGMPRRPAPTDRAFLNLVRTRTTTIVRCRAMVVENSTRRLRAYGVIGTARWYLDGGSGGRALDPR